MIFFLALVSLFLQGVKVCSVLSLREKGIAHGQTHSTEGSGSSKMWALIHNQTLMNHAILLKSTVLKSTT